MRITTFVAIASAGIVSSMGRPASAQPFKLVNAFPHLTFTQPLFLTHSNDGTNRIFVVQQNGIIDVFPNDSTTSSATTFLNIGNKLSSSSGEEGLLGLALHPRYATNGYFYVDYTAPNPRHTVIARYSVMPGNPNKADSSSEYKLLEIYQPYANHNGGMLMFANDGYLYIGMGDGGSGGDPQNRAQNLDSLLGKILRIDVDAGTPTMHYGIPPDNPFAGNSLGYREEIFAWGLRNPWRFSQDPVTNQIWVGDVGQDLWEEIDLLAKGKNYGWRIMEGFHCYNPPSGCDTTGLTLPIKEYGHTLGDCAITGGYVYRGHRRPDLAGAYVYADYCTGRIWILRYANGGITADSLIVNAGFPISSFGVDQNNELYICNYSGSIQRFAGGVATAVHDQAVDLPAQTLLAQNFPNPFNPSTSIKYQIPRQTDGGQANPKSQSSSDLGFGNWSLEFVSLKVYDVLGREVATLVNEVKEPGTYTVEWNGAGAASGVYYYRLMTPNFIQMRKMLLVR